MHSNIQARNYNFLIQAACLLVSHTRLLDPNYYFEVPQATLPITSVSVAILVQPACNCALPPVAALCKSEHLNPYALQSESHLVFF